MSSGNTLLERYRKGLEEARLADSRTALTKAVRGLPLYLANSYPSLEAARASALTQLDKLIADEENPRARRRSARPQGSTGSSLHASSRRSSVSSAARPPAAAAAAGAACKAVAAASGVQLQQGVAAQTAAPASPSSSSVQHASPAPSAPPPPGLPQIAARAPAPEAARLAAAAPAPCPEHCQCCATLEARVAKLQEQNQQLISTTASLREQLEAVRHEQCQAQRQAATTHAAVLRLQADGAAAAAQIEELTAASAQHAATGDQVSLLRSRQDQLQQRQRVDECERAVVLKVPEPLPTDGTAAPHVQQLLQQQLKLSHLTVVRVQHLSGSSPTGGSSGSGSSGQSGAARRHAYKVSLGSAGERKQVLRVKAERLRGTSLTIDSLLTPEQLASRQRLQPAARQAKAAGKSVRWRYGALLIDGQPFTGPGSMPAPTQQKQLAAAAQPNTDGGWQTVQKRRSAKQQQPKPKPAGAASSAAQASGSAKPKSKPKRKRNKTKQKTTLGGDSGAGTPAAADGSSAGAPAAANDSGAQAASGEQQPPGGAGGSPARVASLGCGQQGSSCPKAQPAAGHGAAPPNTEPPPAAANGSGSKQAAAAAQTAAAASDGAASAPSSPARA